MERNRMTNLFWSAVFMFLSTAWCQDQPHIIFIMGDDHGWHDVGFHNGVIKTPNIDNLAETGVILDNYYVAPNCGPSRAQFLTGKYVTHLGLQHKNLVSCRPSGIPLSERTIADELKDLNYTTHMIGKWHAGFHTTKHLPTNRGFDSFLGMLNGMGDHYSHKSSYMKRSYLDLYEGDKPYRNASGIYSTDLYKNRALDIIDIHNNTGDPMFMYLSFQAPHTPLQAPSKYVSQYAWIKNPDRRNYAAMVTAMDAAIGEIINRLKENGMYENAVVVYSTDNGGQSVVGSRGASNYPLRGNKATFYEGGIRGIGVISSPLLNITGKTKALFHVTDWKPTFIQLAGGEIPDDLDGYGQWQTVAFGGRGVRKEIVYNIDPLSIATSVRDNVVLGVSIDDDDEEEETPTKDTREKVQNLMAPKPTKRRKPNTSKNNKSKKGKVEVKKNKLRRTFSNPLGKNKRQRGKREAKADGDESSGFNVRQLAAIRYSDWKLLTGDHGFNQILPNPDKDLEAFIKAPRSQQPASLVQLFNVTADPTESKNLADRNPQVVNMLLDKLLMHESTARKPYFPPITNKCNPALNGGVWAPYINTR